MGGSKTSLSEKKLQKLFYQSDYEKLLKLTIDAPEPKPPSRCDLYLIVGALTYLGRIEEAEVLFKPREKELDERNLSACLTFLAFAHCRQGNYARVLDLLFRNTKIARSYACPVARFYAYMGAAFYRYYCGRYVVALRLGRKAFKEAVLGNYLFGKFLSTDIMAHAQIKVGNVSVGLKLFDEAVRYSKILGHTEGDDCVHITAACYRAKYGVSSATDLAEMEGFLKCHSAQEYYIQSGLLLEIANQLSLRGRVSESKNILSRACRLVYSSSHRRQGIILNLRYAYNYYLSGQADEALNLVRSTKKEFDKHVDRDLELQLTGLELKIQSALGIADENDTLLRRIQFLTSYTGMGIGRRILGRRASVPALLSGEDVIGDLLDLAQSKKMDALPAILSSGYLSFLYDVLPVMPGESVIYLNALSGSLIVFDKGDILYQSSGVSQTIRSLLQLLTESEVTKQTLIEKVWGYQYDSQRHDPLIYPAISRLRQLLGDRAHWIEATDAGYRLAPGIRVRSHRLKMVPAHAPEMTVPQSAPEVDTLNHRQLDILRYLEGNSSIDVQTCLKLFETSQITASRDLSTLHRLAMVRKFGNGRATKYYPMKDQPMKEAT